VLNTLKLFVSGTVMLAIDVPSSSACSFGVRIGLREAEIELVVARWAMLTVYSTHSPANVSPRR
jgi:hypothetical protein